MERWGDGQKRGSIRDEMLPRTSTRHRRWREGAMARRDEEDRMKGDQQPVPDTGDGEKGRLEKGSRKTRDEVGPKTSYRHVRWGEGLIRKWTRKTRGEVGPRDST